MILLPEKVELVVRKFKAKYMLYQDVLGLKRFNDLSTLSKFKIMKSEFAISLVEFAFLPCLAKYGDNLEKYVCPLKRFNDFVLFKTAGVSIGILAKKYLNDERWRSRNK